MGYLDNLKGFGILAITVGLLTTLFNILSFHDIPFFMVSKSIPAIMMILIGIGAYRMKVNIKVKVVYMYLMYVGIGLFISGMLLYYYYLDRYGIPEIAWQYVLIAPLGFILAVLAIIIRRRNAVSNRHWRILQILFISLTAFSVLELVETLLDGDILFMDHLIKIIRDIFQILTAILLYLTLSAEITGKTRIHSILDYVGVPSRK